MLVFRVSHTKYARDISGKGAERNGGRWNHKNTSCVYTSESRALAVLEYAVNIDLDSIPRALSISEIAVADELVLQLEQRMLPGDWRSPESPKLTRDFLQKYLTPDGAAVIKLPSVVISQEHNYILNPRHRRFPEIKISGVFDFIFDVRIK